MSEVKWIKVTTDIFDDEKILLIESLPEADSIIVIWFKLLCLAGKCNNSGVFMMNDKIAYTESMLATIFRRKETTVRLALETFANFGMVEIIDNVITIPNWGKHQSVDKIEAHNEYMRKYMKEYRAKQKQIATKSESKKEEHSEEFEQFWSVYPKKKSKESARKAFDKAIKKIDLQTMLDAVEAQKRSKQWKEKDGQFIPYPATWLNAECWNDEVEADRSVRETTSKRSSLEALAKQMGVET